MRNGDYCRFISRYQVEIQKHCEPLFQHLGINYFTYGRVNKNNSGLMISSYPEWIDYRLQLSNPYNLILTNKMSYWDHFIGDEMAWVIEGKNKFNLHRGMTLIYERSNYYEFGEFAEPKFNPKNKFLLTNPEVLSEFIAYFREKLSGIIRRMEEDYRFHFNIMKQENDFSCEKFLDSIKVNKYLLSNGEREQKVSRREYQCFKLFIKNYSSKEIAKNLALSPRTVENYLNNIKQKLTCNNKYDLIKVAVSNGVL